MPTTTETFPTLLEAIEAARSDAQALAPDDEDGCVYICRPGCDNPDDGHCPSCFAVEPGDTRTTDELIAAFLRMH